MLLPIVTNVKATVLLVEVLLVLDVIPLTFYLKADVVAFVYIGRCCDQCVADIF